MAGPVSAVASVCGDGVTEFPEQCDDGNTLTGDGCSGICNDECSSLTGDWLAESTAPGSLNSIWEIVEDGFGDLVVTTPTDVLTGTRLIPGERSEIELAATNEPFTFTGEMTSCNAIALDIDQLPYVVTLTRQTTPPACPGALSIADASLAFGRLGGVSGDETLVARGRIQLPASPPPGTSTMGAQLLIEDLGAGSARLVDVTYLTRSIPSSSADTCATQSEGWRRQTYKSIVKLGDPPACILGTAERLIAKFSDAGDSERKFNFRLKGASIAAPVGPLRLTVALGSSAGAFAAATCGLPQPILACAPNPSHTASRCR